VNMREKVLHLASLWEECASIMQNCHTVDEIRTGFLKCSEILSSNPDADELVRRLRDWSRKQGSSMADFELNSVRDTMIQEFARSSEFMQDMASGLPSSKPKRKK
jgi:uncharacterized protein YigA (DUF484 family)